MHVLVRRHESQLAKESTVNRLIIFYVKILCDSVGFLVGRLAGISVRTANCKLKLAVTCMC
jgi:hypothetical protein